MPRYSAYTPVAGVAVAAAGTAKTMLAVDPVATGNIFLKGFGCWFTGVVGNAINNVVEVCSFTGAGAGAGSTALVTGTTLAQTRGSPITWDGSGAYGYTTEPTVLSCLRPFGVHPTGSLYYEFGLGEEFESAAGVGFALRVTVPTGQAVGYNCAAWMAIED